jgi:hypothetical protein
MLRLHSQFQSFRFSSSTRSLEEKKSFEGVNPDEFRACEDGILGVVQKEGWYQVRNVLNISPFICALVFARRSSSPW